MLSHLFVYKYNLMINWGHLVIYFSRNFWSEPGAECRTLHLLYTWLYRDGLQVSQALLSTGVGLSKACASLLLYNICCQEHRLVAWAHRTQMICLEWWWSKTSGSDLVLIADVNALACTQPVPSCALAWHSCSANGRIILMHANSNVNF